MDMFCSRCGEAEAYGPDDHDCVGNLVRQIAKVSRQKVGWDLLSRSELLELEEKLAVLYEHLRSLTAYFSNEMERAREKRDQVYLKKQEAARPLNAVRALIRARMEEVS